VSSATLEQAFNQLWEWCRVRDFAGYDPFDALNSHRFRALPLSQTRVARLTWTQLVKRSPINLRNIANVPAEKNSKGIALFALAALARHRTSPDASTEAQARELLDQLIAMQLEGWTGAAWGYNFAWQSRYFFAPRGTPTIVTTAFATRALIEAYEAFKESKYLEKARSVCEFVLHDLPRPVNSEREVCFSYAPQTNTRIYNASMLAAETLAAVGSKTGESELLNLALRAANYVVRQQRADSAWPYGADANQQWIDNFHTAFLLSSLLRVIRYSGEEIGSHLQSSLRRGYEFWRTRFFLADGWPKYYDDALYPADAHAAAAAIVTLCDMTNSSNASATLLAKKIAQWSFDHLRDPEGFFYYQKRRFHTVRIPFMRWSQAWMSYALARLIEETT
jgi:hypothetical protein